MKKINKFDMCKILFILSVFLFEISNYGQNITFINPYKDLLFYLGIFISSFNLFLSIIRMKLNIKKILMILLLIAFAIGVSFVTKDEMFIELIIMLITAINIPFDKILKYDLIIRLILFGLITLSSHFGYAIRTDFFRAGNITRNSFGFYNPNTAAFFILTMFFEFIYIFRNKMNVIKTLLVSLVTFLVINTTDSRSSQLAIVLFAVLYLINNKKIIMKDSKLLKLVIPNLFILFTIISIVVTNLYINKNTMAIDLNELFSTRIWMQSYYLLRYPINLIGNSIEYVYTIDNVFIRTILNFGIIGTLAMNHIYNRIIKTSIKNSDNIMFIIAMVLLVYGTMEWYIIRPVLNVFLFYYSVYFITKRNKEVSK